MSNQTKVVTIENLLRYDKQCGYLNKKEADKYYLPLDGHITLTDAQKAELKGQTGATGKGVKSTVVYYQVGSSGTTIPTGTWNTSVPATSAGQYLWTRVVITYTDNATSTFYSVGVHGATGPKGNTGDTGATFTPSVASDGTLSWTNDKGKTNPSSVNIKGPTGATGNGIKSSTVQYQVSSSGTTTPTETWNNAVPATTAGQYLWTKVVLTFTNNSTSTFYSVACHGATGAKGDKGATGDFGATFTPAVSSDGVLSWTNNKSLANPASVNIKGPQGAKGDKGATGEKGATGATGVGVQSITTTYQVASSGTTAPTGTWNSAVPSTSAGQFLWTRTIVTLTNNTSSTFYSVSRNGSNGAQGPQGVKGDTGAQGPQGVKGDTGTAAGFGTPTASVDANVGTPSVTVTASGANTAKVFNFAFKNLKGQTGATGAAAGFGTPTASVDANVGTPSVTVTASGANTAKVFNFAFKNLKGATGAQGPKGADGVYKGITKHTMTTSNTSVTLNPNEVYFFPTMSTLTIALGTATSMFDEYHFFFTSGSTKTTLTIPSAVKLPDGFEIEANKTYEISIANNLLLYQGWE